MKYIDLHCDTLLAAFEKGKTQINVMPEAMIDVERLKKGGAAAQFFAIFMLPEAEKNNSGRMIPEDDVYINKLSGILHNSIQENENNLAFARNGVQLEENLKNGKISAFLTLEDGRSINGSMEKLEYYYDMGVRLISLTWNFANCLGYPNSPDEELMKKGLTAFGKEAVERMEELGMLVDVSHLSDGGFYDVADICKGPFVASHSNCRALTPHPRNLTDEMIRIVAEKGGVIGLNFAPGFLGKDIHNSDSRVEDMIRHLQHLWNKGGEDCLALGSDLDGIGGNLEIGSPDQMPRLFDAMSKAGFSGRMIEKMAYENAARVIQEVMK